LTIAVNEATPTAGRKRVAAILRRLEKMYGPVEPPPVGPVLDELIATILSQNTSDANSGAAYEELCRRFDGWDAVRRASPARIARTIRRAGLANRKAPRIRAILQQIHEERGELSLEFLREMPTPEAVEYLRRFSGVGPKTVACVLLFACRRPVLPVDTHVHRVSRRLGLIGQRTGADKAHQLLARLVPPGRVLDFHIQWIRHGRTVCSARSPGCEGCSLLDLCPEGMKRLAAGSRGTP
jgi:endonuclease-3